MNNISDVYYPAQFGIPSGMGGRLSADRTVAAVYCVEAPRRVAGGVLAESAASPRFERSGNTLNAVEQRQAQAEAAISPAVADVYHRFEHADDVMDAAVSAAYINFRMPRISFWQQDDGGMFSAQDQRYGKCSAFFWRSGSSARDYHTADHGPPAAGRSEIYDEKAGVVRRPPRSFCFLFFTLFGTGKAGVCGVWQELKQLIMGLREAEDGEFPGEGVSTIY